MNELIEAAPPNLPLPAPNPQQILESFLNSQAPVKDEVYEVGEIILRTGFSGKCFSDLVAYAQRHQGYTMGIDAILGMQIPQEGHIAEAIRARLTGDRQYVATMASNYKALYETSKYAFWPHKNPNGLQGESLTDRTRERMQDSGSAPFEYLEKNSLERVKSIDALLVTCNRILERENILLRRGAAG